MGMGTAPLALTPKQATGVVTPPDPKVVGANTGTGANDERWRSFYSQKWQDMRTAYTVYHQIVWQNLLYYAGLLWIQWSKDRRTYYSAVPEDEFTPQPNINRYAAAVDSVASIFQVPEVEASPKQEDNMQAHEVAEVANVLAREFMMRNGLASTMNGKESAGDHAGQLFVMAGNVFTKVYPKKANVRQRPIIDTVPMAQVACQQCGLSNTVSPDDPSITSPPPAPSDQLMGQTVNGPGITPGMPSPSGPTCPGCGNPAQVTPTMHAQVRKDPISGQPMTEPIITWDVKCDVGNPLYALPRPGAKSFDKQRWMFWAERMSLDEIYENYDNFEAQPDNNFLDSSESSWEIAMNYYFTGYSNLSLSSKEAALVVTIYIEPNKVKDIPEGGIATIINDKVIKVLPWDDIEACQIGHQLTHMGYLKMPTTYFCRTPANDVAEIQKELNRYEAVIALHAMTSASDSLIIDENTKVSNVTGRGDRIIYYKSIGPGSKEPHRLQHGSLDEGIYGQRQTLMADIQNITGAVNVWRGQQAGSVTAAAAISQLRGQAEQMFSKPTDNWRNGWVETIRKGVLLMQRVMQPWEIAEIMGKGHDVQIAKFKGADLTKMLDFVATSHGLPRTRDEKRNDMLSLYDRGALDITDPNVKIRINELFGETGMEQMFNRDATRARSENDGMTQGKPPNFMPDVEDLQVHLYVHGEFIKRLDFDQLDSLIQQAILEHYMETKMAIQQQMMMQAAAGAAPGPSAGPGAPPPPPGGGAPGPGDAHPNGPGPKGEKGAPGQPGSSPARGRNRPKPSARRPGGTNNLTTPTGPSGPGSEGVPK